MSDPKNRKVGNSLEIVFPKEGQDILNIFDGIMNAHSRYHFRWMLKNVDFNSEELEWISANLEDRLCLP